MDKLGELLARVGEPQPDTESGGYILPLHLERNEQKSIFVLMDAIETTKLDPKDEGRLQVEIGKISRKRSLNANAFMWAICGDIARAINDHTITKDNVYRENIRLTNAYIDRIYNDRQEYERGRRIWQGNGTGWISEVVAEYDDKSILAREYYGSSAYTTKEMAYLIELLKEDARQYDLEYIPEQIKSLLDDWEEENG